MQWAIDLLVSLVSVGVVGSYIRATRDHFVSENMQLGAKLISAIVLLTTAVFLVLTWAVSQPLWAQLAGLAAEIASGFLFFATIRASKAARLRFAFDPEAPHTLLQEGPYKYVRHPFYTSYLIFWAGWAVASWSVFGLLNLFVLAILYVWAARFEEQSFLGTGLGEEYRAYKARTGLFWPKLN
jgi:protein-S-isoprenylcysteine O-methyltransferase Ste14